MSNFNNYIQELYPLGNDDFDALSALFEPLHYHKKDLVFTSNTTFRYIYFLSKGIMRCYVLKDGKEITTEIITEPTFYTDLLSIRKKVPSSLSIQALDECFCYRANFNDLEQLINQNIHIKRMMFTFYEKLYIKGIQRQVSFIYDSQEERYQKFVKSNKDVMPKIPFRYLASYLGLQPETLSRIRKLGERC
jgi:CRP-like cAMP-binding protein